LNANLVEFGLCLLSTNFRLSDMSDLRKNAASVGQLWYILHVFRQTLCVICHHL